LLALAGCHGKQTLPAAESGHAHGEGSVPYTVFSDFCEYFAEITPMVKGDTSEASIHITRLHDYKPFAEGIMLVRVLQNGRLIGSGETNQPRIPGIFPVKFTPSASGEVSLQIVFTNPELKDSVMIPAATVYESDELADQAPAPEAPSGVVRFTKEMAWKTDFRVMKVAPAEFQHSIKVSGELSLVPSNISTLSAQSDGILVFRQPEIVPGAYVTKGTILFSLSGKGLTSKNIDANISEMKTRYDASREAYMRESDLVRSQIVSQKQYKETLARYRVDSARYFAFVSGLSGNIMNLVSPASGYIQQVYQTNGAFVAEGMPVIAIGSSERMILRADLPRQYWKELPQISTASFRPSGSNQMFSINEMDGKLIAKSSVVSTENHFIPVSFEFSNKGNFMTGTFAEVFLHTTTSPNQLVVPLSALMEEQGIFYVYLQVGGEAFIKRQVTTGVNDGILTTVLSGIVPGDRVVTRGAIFIKASSQITGAPSHGHEH
jgi:RND family efflux transporter MFP subunit